MNCTSISSCRPPQAGNSRSEANIGAPQVAYRETISRSIEHTYTHKKQSGGSGQFAEVKLEISPTEPGEGYSF